MTALHAPPPPPVRRLALYGDLIDFVATPALEDPHSVGPRVRQGHWVLVEDGRIVAVQHQAPGDDWLQVAQPGRWILPGFVDAHVHSAQVDVIGAWGTQLLDWLETHTFPAEQRFADRAHAQAQSALFLDGLLAAGTTTAMVFPTVHAHSAEALFEAALQRHMRLIAGKVLMDRHAPEALRDDVTHAEAECAALIAHWHGRGRLAYALTPRFAPTSSPEQLAMAGRLLRSAPDLYLQTHVAENTAEVQWVAELFPEARSYLDVYARHGLLGPRSMLAHGIWLDEADRQLLQDQGGALAFCPSSNLFLGSGLFDWAAARAANVGVAMASDVGGGTHLSMLRTLADAHKVQALAGKHVTAWALLHAATLGGAQALGLADEIGEIEPGRQADLVVWDAACTPIEARRQQVAHNLHDALFAWITQGDDRHVVQTWVAGRCRYQRPRSSEPSQSEL